MKIGIVADLHLNKSIFKGVSDREKPGMPFRYCDFMRSFEYICGKMIEEKVEFVIINGDIYDNEYPTNPIQGFFSSQLHRLVNAKIPVLILLGNHDVCRKHHALKSIKELNLNNIKVIETPQIINYKNKAQLLLFPYSLDIESQKISIKDAFYNFAKEFKEKRIESLPALFFGHFGVRGAAINQYEGKKTKQIKNKNSEDTDTTTTLIKDFINKNPEDISLDDLDNIGANYVFLGDYHKFNVLNTSNCIAMYTGSIEKNDFNEINQKKGFVIYDDDMQSDVKMGQTKFIEYPFCRPMLELKGSFEEIQKQFEKIDHTKYQNGIFKISFIGDTKQLMSFSAGLDELKKSIIQKTNAIHIFHEQKVKNNQMEELASDIAKEIDEKGHIEFTDVIEVVKEMITEQVSDPEEKNVIINLAIDIKEKATERK